MFNAPITQSNKILPTPNDSVFTLQRKKFSVEVTFLRKKGQKIAHQARILIRRLIDDHEHMIFHLPTKGHQLFVMLPRRYLLM